VKKAGRMAEEGGYHLVARRKRKLDREKCQSLPIISEFCLRGGLYRRKIAETQPGCDGVIRKGSLPGGFRVGGPLARVYFIFCRHLPGKLPVWRIGHELMWLLLVSK